MTVVTIEVNVGLGGVIDQLDVVKALCFVPKNLHLIGAIAEDELIRPVALLDEEPTTD
jgi:hypothetical protein